MSTPDIPQSQPQPNIVGMITPEAAETLANTSVYSGEALNNSSEPAKIMQSIGASLMAHENGEPQYALVVGKNDENGGAKPLHYVAVDVEHLGTRIQPRNNEKLGLPEPDAKYDELVERAFSEEAAKTPNTEIISVEKGKEPSFPKIEFSADQISDTETLINVLKPAAEEGQAESFMNSKLDYLQKRYSDQPEEFKKMMLIWGTIAAGAGQTSSFMQSVVTTLRQINILSPEDKRTFENMLNTVLNAKTEVGRTPQQGTYAATDIITPRLSFLAEQEAKGKDVSNERLTAVAMMVGVSAGFPEFERNALPFLELMQKQHASPQQ